MDWKTYELAQELYAQYGNICEVHRKLKEQGIKKAQCTLYNWYHKNKEDWDQLRESYRDNKKTKFVESLGDTLFQEMVEINDLLLKKVKTGLESEDKKVNTQAVITLQRQVDSLLNQLETRQKDSNKAERYAKKLIEVLLSHKVIGPLLRRFINEILDKVKKELRNG